MGNSHVAPIKDQASRAPKNCQTGNSAAGTALRNVERVFSPTLRQGPGYSPPKPRTGASLYAALARTISTEETLRRERR